MTTTTTSGMLTVTELAAQLNVHRNWVYEQVKLNLIPHLRLPTGMIRFREDEVAAWLDSLASDGGGPRPLRDY